ncbi:MAG: DNA-directed RNA polymerase subunit beta' [Erysipelotrichaceae bacterium]
MGVNNFAAIQIGLASPERIKEWSYGEVKKAETINHRSQKPERDGLFCEKIFGPSKDWECYCGKYKKVRYEGVICDRCGVEITRSNVRRERMGHIELAAPVAQIWYLRGIPSRMSLLVDIPPKTLEEIVYFVSWVVIDPKDTPLAYKQVLNEKDYRDFLAQYGYGSFEAKTGAEAVGEILSKIDLEKEHEDILEKLEGTSGEKRKKLIKRLETVESFLYSDNKPEWMILNILPVIPPDLRPMLQLDGGRFAASDLNDLYRRVIIRNNRLKKLIELGAPSIMLQNEKRMLQEAVDALIDNGRRSKPVTAAGGRPYKSLSHSLKGKQGRFRQNLLGKRVDFSGRSVIAVGPDLRMDQCGIPREMALQLFKPYVINEIVNQGLVNNPKQAEKLIDKADPRVWKVVEDVIDHHPVLLNRAPTLHRLGIQAFYPKLVEGRAIRLHPLVTAAFNADFDGDQMAVHVPLGEKARAEAEVLMLGSHNILGPKDGKPIVTPAQDLVLGNFYLTMEETAEEFLDSAKKARVNGNDRMAEEWETYAANEGHVYASVSEVIKANADKLVHVHNRIAIKASALNKDSITDEQAKKYLITSVGKVIYNTAFPSDFPYINDGNIESGNLADYLVDYGTNVVEYIKSQEIVAPIRKKELGLIISKVFEKYGTDDTAPVLDKIKELGFRFATVAGLTISLSDIIVSTEKDSIVRDGKNQVANLERMFQKGMLTPQEKERHLSKIWDTAKNEIGDSLMSELERKNPINIMAVSGARGNKSHFTQLAGMRGLMARPTQSKSKKEYQPSIIEVPIYSSFREGLNVSEFFVSTHGVRKGMTDTALKTAESGYLTRRLVDVTQDVIVYEDDCGSDVGYLAQEVVDKKNNTVVEKLYDRLEGRFVRDEVIHPKTGEVIAEENAYIDEQLAQAIVDAGVSEVMIRNIFTCESQYGVCKKCYGKNMATGKMVEIGESVGIMAAQSIGEPGTQLTMRTFHTGGVASGESGDITQGLPRVEELFEARKPKHAAIISKIDGEITEISDGDNGGFKITVSNETESIVHKTDSMQTLRSYTKVGEPVQAGDKLTEGNVDPKELLQVAGVLAVQNYILKEVKKVYNAQSIEVSDKHVEVVVKQMLKKLIILDGNDSRLSAGMSISLPRITDINADLLMDGKTAATFKPTLLGISKASVETDSFLSAASFQETTKVLTEAAIRGKIDRLQGLKENVIVGKLIPAGTGKFDDRETSIKIASRVEELKAEREERNIQEEVGRLPDEMFNSPSIRELDKKANRD